MFEQDVCVNMRVCLVAFPPKCPMHPDSIADVATQVVTSQLTACRVRYARQLLGIMQKEQLHRCCSSACAACFHCVLAYVCPT